MSTGIHIYGPPNRTRDSARKFQPGHSLLSSHNTQSDEGSAATGIRFRSCKLNLLQLLSQLDYSAADAMVRDKHIGALADHHPRNLLLVEQSDEVAEL
ncbi:hypothetical protein D3C76_1694320 [compost metagenome]